jgi:signal transduction histidine kinase
VKLRGRFTLTLALAALVPISVAAVVTTQVIASSYKRDYEDTRLAAKSAVEIKRDQLMTDVQSAVESLASKNHPFVDNLLNELIKGGGRIKSETLREYRTQGGQVMRGVPLQLLTITDPENKVLISPHYADQHSNKNEDVRKNAIESTTPPRHGESYFAFDKIRQGAVAETVLLVEGSRLLRDGGLDIAVTGGRMIGADTLGGIRQQGRINARIVRPNGDVVIPPVESWSAFTKDPIRVALPGVDDKPIAYVEIGVSDGGLDNVLFSVTLTSAALAVGALGAVVLVGLFVARRTARDLDRLVEGSLAAARGDLDHRVPVRSDDEIGAVANAFNFMMEDLKVSKERLVIAERIAAWQEIARRLAHEIKNPLTPIQMAMDTLRKTWKKQHPSFDEILEESTTTVLQEADRLKHIVTEFSDFARMPKPELSRVDLNELVRSALALYQGAVRVDASLKPGLPHLDADKNQLNQVLLNLVENARDAIGSRDGGRIWVTTKLGDAQDRIVFIVEDNGPGVPPDLKDKVFAPYFTTKHSKGGTGLGLAIVHRIVSDHGGRIAISDRSGGGARFVIELPLRHGSALLASRI